MVEVKSVTVGVARKELTCLCGLNLLLVLRQEQPWLVDHAVGTGEKEGSQADQLQG